LRLPDEPASGEVCSLGPPALGGHFSTPERTSYPFRMVLRSEPHSLVPGVLLISGHVGIPPKSRASLYTSIPYLAPVEVALWLADPLACWITLLSITRRG